MISFEKSFEKFNLAVKADKVSFKFFGGVFSLTPPRPRVPPYSR